MLRTKLVGLTFILLAVASFLIWQTPALATTGLNDTNPTSTPYLHENQNPRSVSPSHVTQVTPENRIQSQTDVVSSGTEPRVSPSRIALTLNAGESHHDQIHVFTGDKPFGKGDVMFVFDRTGSMGDEISQAKTSAIQIMNDVRSQLPNTWFGVASFMDYPGYYEYPGYSDWYGDSGYGDVPWELNIYPSDNITDVFNSINSLWLGYGQDWPEDYTRVLYEVSRVESVGWRSDAKRIVVLFGDAPTHDMDFAGYNFGGDPGPDAVAQTSDDLDFETVVQQVANEDISVIAVDSGYSPESEATFKGMSIGFDTAPGTNGRYFRLSDASQIPPVTVQMIVSETQQIDHLSLQVTDGYENWVQVTPSEYINVGTNITKTFDISITVPTGTPSGFYPFLVQAMGDGTIMGVTYVEVTVPPSSPIDDLGFRPNVDGFRFSNESSTQTRDMFKQFFGAEQVEYTNGNRIHAADVFYDKFYKTSGTGGSCDGFSAVSLLNYKDLTQPNAGNFAMPHYSPLYSQNKNDDIAEAFAFSQGIQSGLEVNYHGQLMCDLLGKSPKAFYQYLKSQIQNNSPVVLGIRWDKDYYAYFPPKKVLEKGGGHALVPYRFEEPSSDKAYVYVYDSNLPGNDDHRVEFDLTNDKWTYRWPVPLWPDVTIEGDASKCLLRVTPLEMYRHQGVAWWALAGWNVSTTNLAQDSSVQMFATSGPAQLLFTDDEGQRLGWDGLNFYDEIPGAGYFPVERGDGQSPSGFYYIPGNLLYSLQVIGDGDGQADINVWSEGYMVQLSSLEVVTGTTLGLNIPMNGGSISISGVTTDTQGSLSISQLLPDEDRTVGVNNLNLSSGEEITLQFTISGTIGYTDTIKLSTNSPISRTYDLSLQQGGSDGYSVFGHANLVLDPDSESTIELNNWSDIDDVAVLVDLDKNGIIDETRIADNTSSVDSISLEAHPITIHTGGEQVSIAVSVKDQFGAYVADGTPVSFSTNLGTLSIDEGSTSGGLIHLTLTSGSEAGIATIIARIGSIETSLNVTILPYQIYLPLLVR